MKMIDVDMEELICLCKEKRLMCFGAGQKLKNFLTEFLDFRLHTYISCVLDNDEKKHGSKIQIQGVELPVCAFSNFTSDRGQNILILIASGGVCAIYRQLCSCGQLENAVCCYCDFVKVKTREKIEEKRSYPRDFKIYQTPQIPKKIHYCWFGGNKMPEQNCIWIESWKKYCPDYEIIEWNESNYDVFKNQFMAEAYLAKKWSYVSDYARMDIIYQQGGIYLDTDVEIVQNLDALLYQKAFAGIDSSRKISLGLGFGAVAGFPIIKELMELYNGLHFDQKNMIAIPTFLHPFFEKLGYEDNGNFQNLNGMIIYPEKILSGKNNITGAINLTEHTYAVHHYDGSWGSKDAIERKREIIELYRSLHK